MAKKSFTETAAAQNLVAMFGAGEDVKRDPLTGSEAERTRKQKKAPRKKKQEPIKGNPGTAAEPGAIPKGYVLKKESKSIRASILFRPSTLEDLKDWATEKGISFNELVNELLETALEGRSGDNES